MGSAILLALVVVAVGTRVADAIRLKQEESLLRRLPENEAVAYYEVLRQRVGRVRLLRAFGLAGLGAAILVGRRRLFPSETFAEAVQQRVTDIERARILALRELTAFSKREHVPPEAWAPTTVTATDQFPWIFEFTAGPQQLVRVYVPRDGKIELHRVEK